jgi:hypothetical protein
MMRSTWQHCSAIVFEHGLIKFERESTLVVQRAAWYSRYNHTTVVLGSS